LNYDDESFGRHYFAAVKEIAGSITPVPGGLGPMTVAMLIANAI
jgi:methylenetetrahydrofolate dehydrogenase (NADP+)/methenyltetrahydrofolate cyclohydrolase